MNHRSGRNGTPLDRRFTNIALEVRKLGYEPTLFGYTDTTPDPRYYSSDDPFLKTYEQPMEGFKVELLMPTDAPLWIHHLRSRGYDLPRGREDVYRPRSDASKPSDRGHAFLPTIFTAEESETAFVGQKVRDYITAHKEQDWFAHVVFLRPHPPIIAPEPYNAMYDPKEAPPPMRKREAQEESKQHPHLAMMIECLRHSKMEHHPANMVGMEDLELAQLRATYFGLITQVDAEIGKIIEHLKQQGEYENTLIVFTCDHGEMLGDHYCWGKEAYFEQSFRIPLILRDPTPEADAMRGRQYEEFTESVDIMPLILDWLGAPIPQQCDGHSLLPFARTGKPKKWRDHAFTELDFRSSSWSDLEAEKTLDLLPDQCVLAIIRDPRYKYVHFASLPPLLFDLTQDPWEMTNLADHPAYIDIRLRMMQKMLDWRLLHMDRTLANMQIDPQGPLLRHPERAF